MKVVYNVCVVWHPAVNICYFNILNVQPIIEWHVYESWAFTPKAKVIFSKSKLTSVLCCSCPVLSTEHFSWLLISENVFKRRGKHRLSLILNLVRRFTLLFERYLHQTMASAQGYDDERFESPVPENLHCVICLGVLRKPMQCVRNEHSFCQPCITRHLQETAQSCPTCIERLTLETLRPSRIITQLLSQLVIRCDNSLRGCQESVKVEMLEGHVANCEFGAVKCSNAGCDEVMNRRDRAKHENIECAFRKGKCEVCGEDVAYEKRKLHCYVTRNEMKEMKDEIKDEMSSVKEAVMNMSSEFTRHMADMKDQMGEMKQQMKDQMGELKGQMGTIGRQVNDLKSDFEKMKRKEGSVKQEPQISPRGSLATRSEENWNVREDILIAGGGLQLVEMFSWTTRQWTLLSPMTSQRYFSSSFVHEGQMFVCGGAWEDTMASLELKEEGAQWKEVEAKLPQDTWGHASIVYNEHVYIFGGQSDGEVVSNIYKVSLVSPYSSQLVYNLPEPRRDHGAQCFGNQVAIVGGTTTGDYSDSLDSVLLYDITRNCCRTLAPLPFAVSHMATVALGDNIIIIGGCDKNGNQLNTVVSYNITNEKSEMLPSMKQKRSCCAAVITGNVIVVMGGDDEKRNDLNSVESFSFDRYSWKELPSMNEKRVGATAVLK